MRFLVFAAMLFAAGCGADGDPIRPEVSTSLTVGSGGVDTSTSVSVSNGPVTIGMGF